MTSLPEAQVDRKRLGAWYTSENLITPLVNWAIRTGSERVLDPACGDGAFLVAAARRLRTLCCERPGDQIAGFDVSQAAVNESERALKFEAGLAVAPLLSCQDFFSVHPPGDSESALAPVDVLVGNPPYIRYQSFRGSMRARAVKRCFAAGVEMGRLASSWAPFVVHATTFLKPGGRLALVLPEELIHSSYAEPVRKYLRASFNRTAIISFENHVFPDSQERVVLLVADGYLSRRPGSLQILRVGSPDELGSLAGALKHSDSYTSGEAPGKWLPGAREEYHALLRGLEDRGHLVRLSQLGKAGIGYVSGANDFFVLSEPLAKQHSIPPGFLTPTLTAARHCDGAAVRSSDIQRLAHSGERVLLLQSGGRSTAAVRSYLAHGLAAGIHLRYKCRVRTPWYSVPGVTVPEAFLTYMSSDRGPRFSINIARASCSNTLLAVRLPGVPKRLMRTLAWSFYNSATLLSAELVGRPYGGGVLKLEPSEADRLLVPSLSLLHSASSDPLMFRKVDRLIRSGNRDTAESLVDAALLVEHAGLTEREHGVLRVALTASRQRRAGARRRRPGTEEHAKGRRLWETA